MKFTEAKLEQAIIDLLGQEEEIIMRSELKSNTAFRSNN